MSVCVCENRDQNITSKCFTVSGKRGSKNQSAAIKSGGKKVGGNVSEMKQACLKIKQHKTTGLRGCNVFSPYKSGSL